MKTKSVLFLALAASLISFNACKKKSEPINVTVLPDPTPVVKGLASLTTDSVKNIAAFTAKCGGNVTSEGTSLISAVGVCWSTSPKPTLLNPKTNDGAGVGSFTSTLTNLSSNTTYYVRAYASNGNGTEYGNEFSFKTAPSWQQMNQTAYQFTSSVFFQMKGNLIFALGSGNSLRISNDGGVSFSNLTSLNQQINNFVIVGNDIFVSAIFNTGFYKSSDNGTTWTLFNTGLPNLGNYPIYTNGTDLFSYNSSNSILYKSSPTTANWTSISTSLINNLAIKDGLLLVQFGNQTNFQVSTDGGTTWTNSNLPAGNGIRDIAKNGNNYFVTNGNSDILLSTNNGINWTSKKAGIFNPNSLGGLTVLNNNVYVSSGNGVHQSSDNGNTWNLLDAGLPTSNTFYTTLANNSNNSLLLGVNFFNFPGGSYIYKYILN
jgi:photosystem II stability/assembly factor-like uncharacterized protein